MSPPEGVAFVVRPLLYVCHHMTQSYKTDRNKVLLFNMSHSWAQVKSIIVGTLSPQLYLQHFWMTVFDVISLKWYFRIGVGKTNFKKIQIFATIYLRLQSAVLSHAERIRLCQIGKMSRGFLLSSLFHQAFAIHIAYMHRLHYLMGLLLCFILTTRIQSLIGINCMQRPLRGGGPSQQPPPVSAHPSHWLNIPLDVMSSHVLHNQ